MTQSIKQVPNATREMGLSPTIQQFENQLEQIRKQEMARALKQLKHLGAAEQERIEAITASMLHTIVKLPVRELQAACQRGEPESLLEGLALLFNLEKQPA